MKQNSRNKVKRKNVTTSGNGRGGQGGGMMSQGEGFGPGVRYTTTLNERENKSLNRNAGPSRPMANKGKLPNPGMGVRKTGKVG